MPRSILSTHALPALLAGLLTVATLHAADPAADKAVKVLLNDGWGNTEAAKKLATHVTLDKPPLNDDSSVLEARWLVLMFQGRYDPALDKVKVSLEKNPTSLDTLHAEVWMRMVGQDYSKAMVAARRLGEAIPQPKQGEQLSPAEAAAVEDVLIFLGHVAGFLEGPANKANDSQRQKFENELLARLSNDQKEMFRSAKQEVLSQFRQTREAAGELVQVAESKADVAKQAQQADLNKKAAELAQAQAKADADAKKAKDDAQKKQADLERQDAPLQQEWRRLTMQQQQLNNDIQRLQDQMKRLEQDAADSKNPQQPNAQNALRTAQNQLQTKQNQLAFTNNDISKVEFKHQQLVQQGLANQWQAANQGQGQAADANALKAKAKAIANAQRRVDDGRAKTDAQAQNLARRASNLSAEALAFTTYDRFPFEAVKARLLKALK